MLPRKPQAHRNIWQQFPDPACIFPRLPFHTVTENNPYHEVFYKSDSHTPFHESPMPYKSNQSTAASLLSAVHSVHSNTYPQLIQ